jgi:hypothetical protein
MIAEMVHLVEKLQSRADTKRISLEFPSASELRVVPGAEDTFVIDVGFEHGKFLVGAAHWHAHFDDVEQASAAICWLLTPYYRILRSSKAGADIATWIEIYTNEGWEGLKYVTFDANQGNESPVQNADEIIILQQAVFLDSAFPTYYPAAHLDEAGYPVGTILGETKYQSVNGEWEPVGVPVAE